MLIVVLSILLYVHDYQVPYKANRINDLAESKNRLVRMLACLLVCLLSAYENTRHVRRVH